MPRRRTAARTFDSTCSNANSGVCTPTITRPRSWYAAHHAFRCGSVRRQLMHEYVQKSTSTTLPRNPWSASGFVPIHAPSACSGGAADLRELPLRGAVVLDPVLEERRVCGRHSGEAVVEVEDEPERDEPD